MGLRPLQNRRGERSFQMGHLLEPILSYDRGPPPCCHFCGKVDSLAGEEGSAHRQKECPSRARRPQVDASKREFLQGGRPSSYAEALRGPRWRRQEASVNETGPKHSQAENREEKQHPNNQTIHNQAENRDEKKHHNPSESELEDRKKNGSPGHSPRRNIESTSPRGAPSPRLSRGIMPSPKLSGHSPRRTSPSPILTLNRFDPLSLPEDNNSETTAKADVVMKTETSEEKGERVLAPKKHRIKSKHKNNTARVASADSKTTPPGTKATPSLSIRKETAQRRKNKYVEKAKSQETGTRGPGLSRLAKADPVRPLDLRSPSPRTQSTSENVKLGDRGPLTTLQILQTPDLSSLYVNDSIEDNNSSQMMGARRKEKPMTHQFSLFSQNLQSNYRLFSSTLVDILNKFKKPIICLQDLGFPGPEIPNEFSKTLSPHKILYNGRADRKCRNTAIVVHSDWEILDIRNHPSGGLLGVKLRNGDFQLMVISAYLPPGLDRCGKTLISGAKPDNQDVPRQQEAEDIYSIARTWVSEAELWVLAGDLNETILKEDRKTGSRKGYKVIKDKFVSSFLDISQGIDLWRHLHPITGRTDSGHTRFSKNRRSSARIDYFLLSHQLVSSASACEMEVGARDRSLSDHCRITCHIASPGLLPTLSLHEDIQIRHPNLERLSEDKRLACRDVINRQLTRILIDTRKADHISLETADQISKDVARCIIDNALKIAQETVKDNQGKERPDLPES
jgi:exonuclease III